MVAPVTATELYMKPIFYLIGGIPALIVAGVLAAVKPEALTLTVWICIGLAAGVLSAAAARIFGKGDKDQ